MQNFVSNLLFFSIYLNVCNQTIRLINEQDVINTKQVYEGSVENLINEHAIGMRKGIHEKKSLNNHFLFTTHFRRI